MSLAPLNRVLPLGLLAVGLAAAPAELYRVGSARPAALGRMLTLAWEPSPSEQAVGYVLYWGFHRDGCTNRLEVGNVTLVSLAGFKPGRHYYLAAAAYDATGGESPLSNLLEYQPPKPSIAMGTNVVRWQRVAGDGTAGLRLGFLGQANATYHLQVTENLQDWEVVWTTNCLAAQRIVIEVPISPTVSQRFFRLHVE